KWTRHHAVGRTDSACDSAGLLDSEKVERRILATEEQAGGVRLRPAVAHDDEHGSGRHGQERTTMRPHGSQYTIASGGSRRIRSTSIAASVVWHPVHCVPTS